MQQKKSSAKWYPIWMVIILAVLLAYPGKTGFAGWLPWSMIITFGLMWVIYIAAAVFAKEQLSEDQEER